MRTAVVSRTCLGYGATEGKCSNPAGTPWSLYWCDSCDEARRDKITKSLEEIARGFEKSDGAKP
jgi:hypothetical protein